MNIFYAPDIEKSNILSKEESHHCAGVLRGKVGDNICIIDGKGGLYRAEISVADPRCTMVDILEKTPNFGGRPYRLHMAVAPTKNIDRFEWFVEKAVEIGVDEITPIQCRFSERKVLKLDRLEKIILSATKQSLKAFLPKINPLTDIQTLIKECSDSQKFIAHCYDFPKEPLFSSCQAGGEICIMIGPEGDFSEKEIVEARKSGFQAVSLSNSRLRTETAAVVATEIVALRNENW